MVEILNMAEFFPAAAVIADADGEVQMTLGLGDIRVRAFDGIRRAEAMMRIEEEDSLELVLQEEAVPSADALMRKRLLRIQKRKRFSTGQERILRRFIHSFPKMKIRTGRSCCFHWH